jgi:hypothetical protein
MALVFSTKTVNDWWVGEIQKSGKSMKALASLCNACLLGNFEGENRMYV